MSQSLSPELIKARTGNYSIPIAAMFAEAWHRIKGMKKTFWIAFVLLFFMWVVVCALWLACDSLRFHFLRIICQIFVGGILESLQWFSSIALVFLALQHLRQHAIKVSTAFSLRKLWRVFVSIGFVLYLLFSLMLLAGGAFIFLIFIYTGIKHFTAIGGVGVGIGFILFSFLSTYITVLITMTVVLILDKSLPFRTSFKLAFQAINQHWFRNVALLFLASLIAGLGGIVTVGIGFIWLMPFLSMVLAIQYQQIFCEGNVGIKSIE